MLKRIEKYCETCDVFSSRETDLELQKSMQFVKCEILYYRAMLSAKEGKNYFEPT